MSERHNTHNGRDLDGNFRVKRTDVEDTLEDPAGADIIKDDVRLGGAVADTGPQAGASGEQIERLVDENEYEVDHLVGRDREQSQSHRAPRKHKGNH